jgi:homoserine dehydrogenase
MSTPAQPLRVALLGAGVVGSEVARLLMTQAADLALNVLLEHLEDGR